MIGTGSDQGKVVRVSATGDPPGDTDFVQKAENGPPGNGTHPRGDRRRGSPEQEHPGGTGGAPRAVPEGAAAPGVHVAQPTNAAPSAENRAIVGCPSTGRAQAKKASRSSLQK